MLWTLHAAFLLFGGVPRHLNSNRGAASNVFKAGISQSSKKEGAVCNRTGCYLFCHKLVLHKPRVLRKFKTAAATYPIPLFSFLL